VYKKYGSAAILSVVFSNAMPIIWIADADAIKVITSDKQVFQKDTEIVRASLVLLMSSGRSLMENGLCKV
jgi:hypothetical protein